MTNLFLSLGFGTSLFCFAAGGIESDGVKLGIGLVIFLLTLVFKAGITLTDLKKDVGFIKSEVSDMKSTIKGIPCQKQRYDPCKVKE